MVAARGHARATSCFPGPPSDATTTPRVPSLLSLTRCTLSPSPDSLPRAHPRVAVDAARHSHGHRPPLASPTNPEGPQRRPRHLCRAKLCRTHCITAFFIVFKLQPPRSPATPRSPRSLPEPTDHPCRLDVSSSSFPLRLFARFRAISIVSAEPESHCRQPRGRHG